MLDMPEKPGHSSYSLVDYHLDEVRHKYVARKSNYLIQQSSYTLPADEQKIMVALISRIKPKQNDLVVDFNAKNFVKALGLRNSGTNTRHIATALQDIENHSFWLKDPDSKHHTKRILLPWFENVIQDPDDVGDTNHFRVTFEKKLRGFLLHVSRLYTDVTLSTVMAMQSGYSPRLYEYFRSYKYTQTKSGLNYTVNELKRALNLIYRDKHTHKPIEINGHVKYKYPRFADFNRKVLKPAIKEINAYSPYTVKANKYREGRRVAGITVHMKKKTVKQLNHATFNSVNKINHTHITFKDAYEGHLFDKLDCPRGKNPRNYVKKWAWQNGN